MTMYLDLRENPVTSEDEFMYQFVQQSGYLLPSTEFLARWLLKEKAPKERRTYASLIIGREQGGGEEENEKEEEERKQ